MYIELVEYIGKIKNDTGIYGKAFIFKIILDDTNTFDSILFVHEKIKPFLSLSDEELILNKDKIISLILEKYPLNELLNV